MRDLKTFYENNPAYVAGKELYVLRNMSRGKGIGFFEAGNFFYGPGGRDCRKPPESRADRHQDFPT